MSSLPSGWEINVVFNFFIFNQLQDKHCIVQDWKERRYHAMKTEWGISKFIDLETFHNPVNGYLIDDILVVFGTEVLSKVLSKRSAYHLLKQPATCHHFLVMLIIFRLYLIKRYNYESFGDYNWNIILFPNGNGEAQGSNISI
ncbi:hypothetical protein Pint_16591 [Pistacia integerrima]|uniref:Uncharacterized protein n=1 Tax=Pistacia integerrima TaxID=434235 RepID=A0ACC0ZCS9_9ROSI|nr:hypothetical protein Pint_16591 [Pistacia integerrima]